MGKIEDQNDIIDREDSIISKSNDLIGAKFNSTLLENRIFALGLYNVQRVKVSHGYELVAEFDNNYLREVLGISGNSIYNRLKKIEGELRHKDIFLEDPENHRFIGINIITTTEYRGGKFKIWFNNKLENKIWDLQKNYTRLSLNLMMNWKSVYSYRLYENLKCRYDRDSYLKGVDTVSAVFNISELKFTIGCIEIDNEAATLLQKENPVYEEIEQKILDRDKKLIKYKNWNDFKKRAIDPAVDEINNSIECELSVRYDTKRSGLGGKISGVVFYISKKQKSITSKLSLNEHNSDIVIVNTEKALDDLANASLDVLDEQIDEVRDIIDEKLSTKDLRAIVIAANGYIDKIRKAYEVAKSQPEVKNLVGFIITAIKNSYSAPIGISNKKKDTFSNFDQREYNYTEDEILAINRRKMAERDNGL